MTMTTMRNAGRMTAAWLLMAAGLACAPAGPGMQKASERQKIVVEFALPEGAAGPPGAAAPSANAIGIVAEAILARLDAPAQESARVFENLPMMALEADAATVMRLLGMPEVVSIQRDHPVNVIDAPSGVETYGAPSVPGGG